MRLPLLPLLILSVACSTKDTPCARFYTPYPDFVSGRVRTSSNAAFVDAMTLYRDGDLAGASEGLKAVVERDPKDITARMYLVSALLGSGDPYKAEMHLDFLETWPDQGFRDQVQWYDALCWLCEGNTDRALEQARWIAGLPRHTYTKEAKELVQELTRK